MSFYAYFKQIIDFLLALIGIFLLWPFFLLIAVVIKFDSKGPIFFKQKRVGKNKREFNIFKFRTMRTDTPSNTPTHLLKDPDFFITKVGKFLRKTSLDELPQIINIFKGEMSVVGPRPALWNQVDLIEKRDRYRVYEIKPGLTGWAQVNGRDEVSIERKAELDGYYKKNLNLLLDIKIVFLTILNVFTADGIKEGHQGMLRGDSDGNESMFS
ncbi:sugar transferase ['Paenibacillus yunnanensis' Narsing Rao et al. 2020]|uniref:sugar transferase n=1 Tax=Paenibacillus tengchongensis TaxID=2608684 RepID=UPI00124BEA98|nr:sugar transferase [Paenibacillus tengchongensis]